MMNNPENRPLLVNGTETPSAGELHDMLMEYSQSGFMYPLCAELKYVAKFLLEQQAEIEALKEIIKRLIMDWTDDFKNYKYNSDVPEQNKMRDDVFAILRKAQENGNV